MCVCDAGASASVEKTNVGGHDASEWMNHTGMHTPPINCRADKGLAATTTRHRHGVVWLIDVCAAELDRAMCVCVGGCVGVWVGGSNSPMSSMASRSWLARESVIPDMAELSAARVPCFDCPSLAVDRKACIDHTAHTH